MIAEAVGRAAADASRSFGGDLATSRRGGARCAARDALRAAGLVPHDHPVWSHRPYKVFKYTPEQVRSCTKYVDDNPEKEELPRQYWDFVTLFRF